jgi:TPR repeat protein
MASLMVWQIYSISRRLAIAKVAGIKLYIDSHFMERYNWGEMQQRQQIDGCGMAETEPLTELAYQAESGDAQAQYRMGVLFLVGERVEQDLGAAGRWFHASALNGNNAAVKMNQLSATPSKIPEPTSRSPFFTLLVPFVALLVLSLWSGYEHQRTLNLKAAATNMAIAVSNSTDDAVPATLQARVETTKEPSAASESLSEEKIPRKSLGVRHQKKRSHR